MIRFRALCVAVVIGGALVSRPAAAQYGDASRSLTHVVSVMVPSRVKVKLSPLSLASAPVVPAAVKLTRQPTTASGIGLSVRASQAWVLSMRAGKSSKADSRVRWSPSPSGEFKTLTSADTVLAAGDRTQSAADTAVFFREAHGSGSPTNVDSPIFLTVSAP